MFTGIVEELGEVTAVTDVGDAVRLSVRAPTVTADAAHGDSIAVDGCCLTVVDAGDGVFTADVMKESLDTTALGRLTTGSAVNLERAVRADARLGGHLVQGHVDGVGAVVDRTPSEHWELVRVSVPPALARYLARKGSVTVDGVSLTVVTVDDAADAVDGARADAGAQASFTVSLVPTTLALTTLGGKDVGEPVNLEVDVIAKYVERLLDAREPR